MDDLDVHVAKTTPRKRVAAKPAMKATTKTVRTRTGNAGEDVVITHA